jgi:hypothetical protein
MSTQLFPMGTIIISPPEREVKRGRKPLDGVRAMTGAERSRRYREIKNAGKPKSPRFSQGRSLRKSQKTASCGA